MATAPPVSLADALALHRRGDTADAEQAYRAILTDPQGRPEAAMLLGVLLSERGEQTEAVVHLETAIRCCPDDAAPPYNLGNVCRRQGRLEEALAAYDTAIARDALHASSHLNRGITLIELDRPEEAATAFTVVADLDPANLDVRLQLGELHFTHGRFDEAVRWCLEAVAIDPAHVQARLDAGLACHAAGRRSDAVTHFREATMLAPRLAEAWCNLGGALRDVAELDAAQAALERAIALDPTVVESLRNLAGLQLERRSFQSAMETCERALEIRVDVPTLLLQSRILASSSEYLLAEKPLRHAVELAPDDPRVYVELGELRRRRADLEAADFFAKALALDPTNVDAWLGTLSLARTRRDEVRIDRAVAALEMHGADDPAAVVAIADRHRSRGDAKRAAGMIETLLERPDLAAKTRRTAQFRLGDTRAAAGDHEEAWVAYEAANASVTKSYEHARFVDDVSLIIETDKNGFPLERPATTTCPPRPIFIVGMPRSGTTLTEQILAAHPDVHAAGETQLMARTLTRVEDLTGITEPFPVCLERLGEDGLSRLEAFARGELADLAGDHPVVVEKTTGHALAVGLLYRLFPDARFVWCRRDPLDVCFSCFTCQFHGHHPYANDLEDLGRYAVQHERLMSYWQATYASVLASFEYETLVADQHAATRQLLDWCGLTWDDGCLEFHEVDRVVLTASAEQVRQPLYRSSVGRHQAYATHLGPLRAAMADEAADMSTPSG